MSARSEDEREVLRNKMIGLGERSLMKSHYAALQRSLRELEEKDQLIREAYSDVIAAVTGGRLVLLGQDELDEGMMTSDRPCREMHSPDQLGPARDTVREELGDLPVADDLVLAFSEAATNMLKHANGGRFCVRRDDGRVQILLSDTGPGIDFRHLPKATLMAGYSSAQSLGMGFTLMLELTDRLLLCTNSKGTSLVLEKDLAPAENVAEFAT